MATRNERIAQLEEQVADLARRLSEAMQDNEIIDLAGISRRMRVDRKTPQQWRQRGILPPVDFPEITEPIWRVRTIKEFADNTGRLWYDEPAEPYFTESGKLVAPV